MTVLFTGDRGFIARYAIPELLSHGHRVVGIDHGKKYGFPLQPFDHDPQFTHVDMDAEDVAALCQLLDHHQISDIIANAAMMGGISYFHKYVYDLFRDNERSTFGTLDAAIQSTGVKKVTLLSSPCVYERQREMPIREGDERVIPPALTTYGFQKLSAEYAVEAAAQQYGIRYAIVRPFNCIGIGERPHPDDPGYIHVIPDFITKILQGDVPIEIFGDGMQVRCFTHGIDLARGIRLAMEQVENTDVNIVNPEPITMRHLLQKIWTACGKDGPVPFICLPAKEHDTYQRVGTPDKMHRLTGWAPTISLDEAIPEIIAWIRPYLALKVN